VNVIAVDPVTPPLLIAGHLSFVTVDRPPPVGWIGQRVAIYADQRTPAWLEAIWPPNLPADASKALQPYGERVVMDAIVGSGTLAEALPIMDGSEDDDWTVPMVLNDAGGLTHYGPLLVRVADIGDQLPLQDWSAGRWALRFTDVATRIHDRYLAIGDGPLCPDDWVSCDDSSCGFSHVTFPRPAPVLSGEGTYREWRTT
jgi:hypothetical protein